MLRANPCPIRAQGYTELKPLDYSISMAAETSADTGACLKKCLMRNNLMYFVGSFGNRSYVFSGIWKTKGRHLEGLETKGERWSRFFTKLFKALEPADSESSWTLGFAVQKVINSLLKIKQCKFDLLCCLQPRVLTNNNISLLIPIIHFYRWYDWILMSINDFPEIILL